LIAPRLKIGLGPVRQERRPGALEIGAGLLEGRGGIALVLARMRTRIEAAIPLPWVGVVRITV
jgi:hypothetical protein